MKTIYGLMAGNSAKPHPDPIHHENPDSHNGEKQLWPS